jgi:ribonuclease R
VPVGTLGNDYFRYEERAHALIGQSSGETHRLGDQVSVRLAEAAPVAGALRFELLSEGRPATRRVRKFGRPRREERSRHAAKPRRYARRRR